MLSFFAEHGLSFAFTLFATGAVLSLLFSARVTEHNAWIVAHIYAAFGALFGLVFALLALFSGKTVLLHGAGSLGISPDILTLRVDSLAAFFIATISTVAIAASIFGIRYYTHYAGTYRLGHFGFFYNVFIASMLLVVSANNGFLFLLAWEMMAIASYFLVIYERNEEKNISAGTLYILISQLGAAFLFAAFLLLYRFTGSWDFDVIRSFAPAIPFAVQNTVLALALVGFASKAGVIPLHIWLPEAHPAAPSHVSALMSGVMIKTAIFMLMRFFIDFFPAPHVSWGLLILFLGAVSSLLGVLYALSEHDIKRLLAFHSVENIGIILLGLGASITFFSLNMPAVGIAALIAALYHTVNHALFKALLFLSAGSVVHATHTRNMEEYGGLIKLMPWTSFFFLVGAVAISGLPPFNGFVSEWLTFQSLFVGIAVLPMYGKLIFLLGASSLAFTGGLAAACFVKAFGATFLARPRSHHVELAHESDIGMQFGMGILAVLTVFFGVAASTISPLLAHVALSLRGLPQAPLALSSPVNSINFGNVSSLSMIGITLALIVGALAVAAFTWLMSRRQRVVVSRTWDCGSLLSPRMEITATSFSRSIITIFRGLLRPTLQTDIEYHDAQVRYFAKTKTVHLSLTDIYHTYLYQYIVAAVEKSAREARKIQTGHLNMYLLYMCVTLLGLLVYALK